MGPLGVRHGARWGGVRPTSTRYLACRVAFARTVAPVATIIYLGSSSISSLDFVFFKLLLGQASSETSCLCSSP